MKLITAIIKPVKFDYVYAALEKIGIAGFTATEVQGITQLEPHRGAEGMASFRLKIKIEVAVSDEQHGPVIEVITKAANTGRSGDGRVYVTPLEQSIRIRTGAACEDAG